MKRPLIQSFASAFRGIFIAMATERNFKIHLVAAVIAVALGIYLGLSTVSWCLIVFAISLVLMAECMNTALERMCDYISGGEKSDVIRNAKDIAAGAVWLAAIAALIIGIIVLIIPLIHRLSD
jgi:diacylglycerol kinase